jgi:hypothetical protein
MDLRNLGMRTTDLGDHQWQLTHARPLVCQAKGRACVRAADVAITTFNAAHSYGGSKAEYPLGRHWVAKKTQSCDELDSSEPNRVTPPRLLSVEAAIPWRSRRDHRVQQLLGGRSHGGYRLVEGRAVRH